MVKSTWNSLFKLLSKRTGYTVDSQHRLLLFILKQNNWRSFHFTWLNKILYVMCYVLKLLDKWRIWPVSHLFTFWLSILNRRSTCKMLSEKVSAQHSSSFLNCLYKEMDLLWRPGNFPHRPRRPRRQRLESQLIRALAGHSVSPLKHWGTGGLPPLIYARLPGDSFP